MNDEEQRAAEYKSQIKHIKSLAKGSRLTSYQLKDNLAIVRKVTIGDHWAEFEAEAARAKDYAIEKLTTLIAAQEKNKKSVMHTLDGTACAPNDPKETNMKTAQEREQDFRKELETLLEKHGAELYITDDGKDHGMHRGVALITMFSKFDEANNETAEFTEFYL